jgi:hypothetical protein
MSIRRISRLVKFAVRRNGARMTTRMITTSAAEIDKQGCDIQALPTAPLGTPPGGVFLFKDTKRKPVF